MPRGTSYPTAPSLPGVTFRHVSVPDDLVGMNDLANLVRAADGNQWVTSHEQFRSFYANLSNCDVRTDVMVAERDGGIVGYGRASWQEDHDSLRLYQPTEFAHPDEPPELLAAIHDAMEARCREIAASHPAWPKALDTESTDSALARVALLRARGYAPARYYFTMVRPNLDDLLDSPLPVGLEIRPVQPDQKRPIFDAAVEALPGPCSDRGQHPRASVARHDGRARSAWTARTRAARCTCTRRPAS